MKRLILFILFAVIVSCEETFSPKAEFDEKYVVSCVFGTDGTKEDFACTLYLTKTYDVEGLDPSINKVDPTVPKAKVHVEYSSGQIFWLYEDTLAVYDSVKTDSLVWAIFNRYNNPKIYYRNAHSPIRAQEMKLSVELPNGKILTAKTKFPRGVFFDYSYIFPHGITPNIEQWRHGDYWGISWEPVEDQLYFTSLTFGYSVVIDTITQYKIIEIPMDYVKKNNKLVPVYPGYKKVGDFKFKFSSISRTLQLISKGIEDKSKITVYGISLNIIQFSKELADYFSSINGFFDEYSIRLDERVYTNIENGLGIFGAYKSTAVQHEFD